jgi:uncharacterized protein (TIGR03067 family)
MSIDGVWKPWEAILNGNTLPEEFIESFTLQIEGMKYWMNLGNSIDKGTLKYIKYITPQALEFHGVEGPNEGKIIPAIYKLQGTYLTIAYNLNGSQRPTTFLSTKDNLLYVVKFKKV